MRRRRIMYLGDTAGIAGAEVSLLTLLQKLDRKRFDPVYVSARDGPYLDELKKNGVSVHMVPMAEEVLSVSRTSNLGLWSWAKHAAKLWPTCWAVAQCAKNLRAHLIHTNAPKMHLVGLIAGRLAHRPVVCHIRSADYFGLISWLIARLATRAICISRVARDATFRRDGGRSSIRVIYNGRDLTQFYPRAPEKALKQELGLEEGCKVVALVAHLIPWKGHKLFLQAAKRILRERSDVRFLMVGGYDFCDNGYREELILMARHLGIDRQVVFAGQRSDMVSIYSIIDVLVGASSNEPFGSVLIEGMAMENPVVATRSGGYPEIVVHGKTGLLVPPDSPEEMARSVLCLLNGASAKQRFGPAGRDRVQQVFSAKAHAREVQEVYDELLR